MSKLDAKLYLALDKVEHGLRKAAYLATAEPFQKDIYEVIEVIVKIKKNIEQRLDKNL
ncbi:MAG: hypothetical protein ACW99F_00825 [Candidatus Hodarchaeales archaeon]|jgi:hypothetical protein